MNNNIKNYWEEYCNIFNKMITSVSTTRINSLVAREIFDDFPNKLPTTVQENLSSAYTHIDSNLKRYSENEKIKIPREDPDITMEYFFPFMAIMNRNPIEESTMKIDFNNFIISQEIVMYFANLEAFLLDTEKYIYLTKPDVLKTYGTTPIPLSKILDKENRDEIINDIISETLEKSSYGSCYAKIKKLLSSPFTLTVEIDDNHLKYIEGYNDIRNLIIHRGGVVDSTFFIKHHDMNIEKDKLIPLDSDDSRNLYDLVQLIIYGIFESTSQKFFNKSQTEIDKVSMRWKN